MGAPRIVLGRYTASSVATFRTVFTAASALSLMALLASCSIDSSYDGTRYRCPDGECPTGYFCVAGECRTELPDAGPMVDAPVDLPDAEPPPPDPTLGNLVFYSFDHDDNEVSVARDLGPLRLDGELSSGNAIREGRYGNGLHLDAVEGHHVKIADVAQLYPGAQPITVEAWVLRGESAGQALFSDYNNGPSLPAELSIEFTSDDAIRLITNSGCTGAEVSINSPNDVLPVGAFAHVAVTWDREVARFYVDAQEVGSSPLAVTPCRSEGQRDWFLGRRNGQALALTGVIDEFKLSNYAKSPEQLAESRDYNSSLVSGYCGNGLIEPGEVCDGDDACCERETCTRAADDSACGDSVCQSGVCVAPAERASEGLIAQYVFDEGAGTVVADSSGFGAPLDLSIIDELGTAVAWGEGSLSILAGVEISGGEAPNKISEACVASSELTVEAWLAPANTSQDGPARIVTISSGLSERNFTLGQEDDFYVMRLASELADGNGQPPLYSVKGDVRTDELTHLVATSAKDGTRRLYVDGVLRHVSHYGGDFSDWNTSWQLAIGDEFDNIGARTWRGELHHVAIYSRALSEREVAGNFFAGANP